MAGRTTPPDPNYKLYSQYGGKAKYEAAKKHVMMPNLLRLNLKSLMKNLIKI